MENIVTVDQARRAAGFARQGAHVQRWLGLDATESDRRAAECDALAERLAAEAVVVVVTERETFEAACAVVISEAAHRPTGWLQRDGDFGAWRIALDGATGIVGRLQGGGWIAAVVRVVVVALTVTACGGRPAPVVEEEEPEAWRCVREGRCAVPRDVDGGILGAR